MAEYIERDKVLEEINDRISNIAFTSPYQREIEAIVVGMERARDSVEDAPAAAVAPVVHGRWIPYHEADIGWDEYGVKCSVCNFEVESLNIRLVCNHYCPNCGARMDGE